LTKRSNAVDPSRVRCTASVFDRDALSRRAVAALSRAALGG
jgi:hypothetical protein